MKEVEEGQGASRRLLLLLALQVPWVAGAASTAVERQLRVLRCTAPCCMHDRSSAVCPRTTTPRCRLSRSLDRC